MDNPRILLADDSATLRTMVTSGLTSRNYTVTAVENGFRAILYLKKEKPFDVLVMDIKMPGGGINLFNYCKNIYPELPIVIITGDNLIGSKDQSIIDNCDCHVLYKPFEITALTKLMNTLMRK